MPFDFPSGPTIGQRYQVGDIWWVWNGFAWEQFAVAKLISLTPEFMVSGDPPFLLTMRGRMFARDSQVIFGGIVQATTFINPTELQATVNPTNPPGAVPVYVSVPQVKTNTLTFTITSQITPILDAMIPVHGAQGGTYLVQLVGENFRYDGQVFVDNVAVPYTYISNRRADITIVAPPKGNAKTSSQVIVVNNTASSNELTFRYDTVTIALVSPIAADMGVAINLLVTGTNYTTAEKILVNDVAIPTTFISPLQLVSYGYTPPYTDPVSQPPPLVISRVNVTGSVSPDFNMTLTDKRFRIRSTYPDSFSEYLQLSYDVEVWGWGVMDDNGVVMCGHPTFPGYWKAAPTQKVLNVVHTELIFIFDIEPCRPPSDDWLELRVVNYGVHWSAGPYYFWCDMR